MSAGRIVIADDNGVNRMLLGGILEHAGYDVRAASDGAEALRMIETDPPEMVLLDIQMPELSGYDVSRAMRERSELATIPVVFISALDNVGEKVRGFEAGGVDYVTKPFEAAEVLARVSSQVKLFRLQRELAERNDLLQKRNLELQRRNVQLALAHQRTERVFVALSEALTGTLLDETYRLEEKIGEGGFGAVYRGTHLRLQRPVAVKVLRAIGGVDSDVQLARFRREGIAACRIAHPNAVEVLDFGVSSTGIAYLVMELLSGMTFGTLLRNSHVLPLARTAAIVAPVCDALGAAHAAGIVHRDVKPDNVFLHVQAGSEIVKVVDFGIAKLVDDSLPENDVTQHGTFIGTPVYMAPERLMGSSYDTRSDIYSIGVMLYLSVSGYLPFTTESTNIPEMIKLHLTSKPRSLRSVTHDIDARFADVVMQSLAYDTNHRPTVREIAAELRRWSGGSAAQ
jgi:DNA-binding response OmpR family regulator